MSKIKPQNNGLIFFPEPPKEGQQILGKRIIGEGETCAGIVERVATHRIIDEVIDIIIVRQHNGRYLWYEWQVSTK